MQSTRGLRRPFVLAISLLLALSVAACGQAAPAPGPGTQSGQGAPAGQPGKPMIKVRFGYQQTVWGAPAMLAIQEKVWDKYGLQVEPIVLGSGKEVRDAMVAGSVDIGSIGATPLVVGAAKADVVAIGAAAYAGDTLGIVVARDSGIKSVGDLKGKKVASQTGSATDFTLRQVVLPAFGLKQGDIQPVNVKFEDMVAALAGHSVDAFAGVEPYLALAAEQGIGVKIVTFGSYDLTPLFLGAQGKFVKEHPDAVVAFLKGWRDVVDQFNTDSDRVTQTLVDAFGKAGWKMSKKVIADSLAGMQVTMAYRSNLNQYLDGQAQDLLKDKSITSVPDWGKVLLTDPLRKATAG